MLDLTDTVNKSTLENRFPELDLSMNWTIFASGIQMVMKSNGWL
jgi:hypothetical protein